MSEESDKTLRTVATVMYKVPGLVLRFGLFYLKFKRKMRKGAKVLRKSLIKSGMSKAQAKELAEVYEVSFSIRELLKDQGVPGFNIFN